MADYYSLLARAVANLPKSSPPSTRRAIYDRARKALTNQLRSLKPQLPESDIAREERALDEAVARLEAEFEPAMADVRPLPIAAGSVDAAEAAPPAPPAAAAPPAPPPAPPPATNPAPSAPPAPPPPRPVQPPISRMPAGARPAAPSPPKAPTPPPAPPPAKPNTPPTAGLPNAAAFRPPTLGSAEPPPRAPGEVEESFEPPLGSARAPDAEEGMQGPVPPIDPAGSRYEREATRPTLAGLGRRKTPTWLWIGGAIAVGFAGSIAVAAFLMRPALQDLTPPVDTPAPAPSAAQEKLPSRIGSTGDETPTPIPTPPTTPPIATATPDASPTPTPTETPTPEASASPTPSPSAVAPTATPTAAPTVPIASRAAMLVATVQDAAKPAISVGTAVWSIIPAPPGQPAGIGVKADVEIPELKMRASMILRKNLDATLPASHTIDLRLTFDPGSPVKGVKDIALPLMRRDDPPAADALAGVRVKISDNYFLVGLNRGDADVARNVQEIAERGWFDFPMQLDDDRIAKLTFEKGSDGEKAVAQALAAWK